VVQLLITEDLVFCKVLAGFLARQAWVVYDEGTFGGIIVRYVPWL